MKSRTRLGHHSSRPVAPPSSPEVTTAVAVRVAVARIYRFLRIRTERNITPSQTSALARIGQAGPLRLGALAQLEGIAPATMSRVVDSLEAQALIERVPDALDGRASLIQLSREGGELLHQMQSTSTVAIDQALASLSASERALMERAVPVLEKLSDLLQASAVLHRAE